MSLPKKLAAVFGKPVEKDRSGDWQYRVVKDGVTYTVARKSWVLPYAKMGWAAYPPKTLDPKKHKTKYGDTLEDLAYELGFDLEDGLVSCKFCHKPARADTAHLHDGEYVGECCWDERLKVTE